MNLDEKLQSVEESYRRVLALTRTQLELIKAGKFDELGAILQKKSDEIESTGIVIAELKTLTGLREREALKRTMVKLGAIIDQVMEIENHCQKECAPPAAPALPRAAAANMYRRNVR